ncbi:helix-turn-helix domain-containing protein [Pseudomonas sp. NW5]|uniref:helix-turn-helix transcriptional regulator n=1 Tax=Pseudomonas sp. NW5 TaxID=2934934 RepID=UPI0020214E43|nr:helix-turn-helix domain-containing protein [Pseudomonas sp. NW5]MCL7462691.1 helix-turn-helix domain-containing protein [Pseudomonas sp. NW5]
MTDVHHQDEVSFTAPKRWLRAREAAEYLGVSVPHLARLREVRKGPPYRKFGAAVLYDVRELDAFVLAQPRFETKGGVQ